MGVGTPVTWRLQAQRVRTGRAWRAPVAALVEADGKALSSLAGLGVELSPGLPAHAEVLLPCLIYSSVPALNKSLCLAGSL